MARELTLALSVVVMSPVLACAGWWAMDWWHRHHIEPWEPLGIPQTEGVE